MSRGVLALLSQLHAVAHVRHTPCHSLEVCDKHTHTQTHKHVGTPGTRTDAQEWMWGEGADASTACLKSKLEEEELGMRGMYATFFGRTRTLCVSSSTV